MKLYNEKWYSWLNRKYLRIIPIIIIAIFREEIVKLFDGTIYADSIPENIWIFIYIPLILIVWIIIYKEFSKRKNISKLKSWEIQRLEINWNVKEIKYITNSKNHKITWWYIIVEWVDSLTNEIRIYEWEAHSYEDPDLRAFRLFWPLKKDIEELYKYVNQYIKVWDPIKIIVSLENPKIYYIEEPTINQQN